MLYSNFKFFPVPQTDHDPRAPAYVAAQGPLPSTLAHFWQMIWEQGAVVIVALCRLQENGEVACARYWPEEGAEVYHIYEVGSKRMLNLKSMLTDIDPIIGSPG